MDYLPHLLALGSPSSDRRMRDRASRALLEALRRDAPVHAKEFRNLLHSHQDLEDAHVHVVMRASRGTQRFRGTHGDRSARSWIETVLRNYLIDIDRRRRRQARAIERLQRGVAEAQSRQAEDERRKAEAHELASKVIALVRLRVHRERSGMERLRKIRLGVEAVWVPDSSTRRQLVEFNYLPERDLDDSAMFKAARGRLYQDRRRGRIDLAKVIGQLVHSGELEAKTAAAFCAVSLVPWPPPSTPPEVA